MPSAAQTMVCWCIDVTWRPNTSYPTPLTRTLRFLATANNSAYVTQMAIAQCGSLSSGDPATGSPPTANMLAPTFGTPYLDSDQTWSVT